MLNIKVRRCHPDAVLPAYATEGAACFDLHTITEGSPIPVLVCRTGLQFEIPPGWVMKIYSRSGHGFKHNVRLANCIGVIDSDYRGEVIVKLTHDGDWMGHPFYVRKGERIAQAMLERVAPVVMTEVAELSETTRGAGGFGSTGK